MCLLILTNYNYNWNILENILNMKFYENPFAEGQTVTRGQMDGHDKARSSYSLRGSAKIVVIISFSVFHSSYIKRLSFGKGFQT